MAVPEQGRRVDFFHQLDRKRTADVLPRITGQDIEQRLLQLAEFGGRKIPGTPEQPTRYATNRLALSPEDHAARTQIIVPQMKEAGATKIISHPFGIIGKFEGTDPNLAPIVLLSHTDTVPNGDMYDGVYGVEAAIAATKAMTEAGEKPKRTVLVISLTGEESAGFGMALFGSRAMFQGLTDAELDSRSARQGAKSIRETLLEQGVDIATVQQPIFGEGKPFQTPYAVLELHVDQSGDLERKGVDVGVVEAIAAPVRHRVVIGNPLEVDHTTYPSTRYLKLDVAGKADHSGATPMGPQRADGLVATADALIDLLTFHPNISIGDIAIPGQAINKIPGQTTTTLRITGNSRQETDELIRFLETEIEAQNNLYAQSTTAFGPSPISLEEVDSSQVTTNFYHPADIDPAQVATLAFIKDVCDAAEDAGEGSVGTIGTIRIDKGQFVLEVDVRGTNKRARDKAMEAIRASADSLTKQDIPVNMGNPLPGSGEDPVTLDRYLVDLAEDTIKNLYLARYTVCTSAAGHDAQNAQRADAPTVMLFVPSRNGIAHNPEAYTSPEHLEKGAKALAAVMLRLAA